MGDFFQAAGILVALGALAWQIRAARQEMAYRSFLDVNRQYEYARAHGRDLWHRIREKLRENPELAHEAHDKQNTMSYLLLRADQPEGFFAVEHELLDTELRSLNLLNELCEMAAGRERQSRFLCLTAAADLSYYQNRLPDLLKLYDRERQLRAFPRPRYDALRAFDVSRCYDAPPGPRI